MNNTSSTILLVLLLGAFAQGNNVDLATNSSFLFLLLLILLGIDNNSCNCNNRTVTTTSALFPNQFITTNF